VNIETSRRDIFSEIYPDKRDYWRDLVLRLKWCSEIVSKILHKSICRGGVSTKLIVRLREWDLDHLMAMDVLFRKFKLKRIYSSAFTPILNTPLENGEKCSKERICIISSLISNENYMFTLKELKSILNDEDMLPYGNLKTIYVK